MEHLWALDKFLSGAARRGADNRAACVIYGSELAWVPTANDGIKGSLARQDAITALHGEVLARASSWRLHLNFKWDLN